MAGRGPIDRRCLAFSWHDAGVIRVTFLTGDGKVATAAAPTSLLRLSIRTAAGIPFQCGGGICGLCKCRIEQGREAADAVKPKERRHLTEAELAAGYRMACQTIVSGALAVSWMPAGPPAPGTAA